jgi:hypothetical protein
MERSESEDEDRGSELECADRAGEDGMMAVEGRAEEVPPEEAGAERFKLVLSTAGSPVDGSSDWELVLRPSSAVDPAASALTLPLSSALVLA